VRESLFARLGDLRGLAVLDLFAGSGALGIEALSRGAARGHFVDRRTDCVACVRANLEALGLASRARVLRGDVLRALARLGREGERFGLVLADPPYAPGAADPVLAALVRSGVLEAGALVVIETDRRHPPGRVRGLAELDQRCIGGTEITRYSLADAPPSAGPAGDPGEEEPR